MLTSLRGRSAVRVNADRVRALRPQSPFQAADFDAASVRKRFRDHLRELLALPSARSPLEPKVLSSGSRPGVTIEEFEYRSEEQIRVPGWFMTPSEVKRRFPVVLYVTENGKDASMDESSEMQAVVQLGFALCAIGLRGQGKTTPSFPAEAPLGYSSGGGKRLRDDYAWASLTLGKPVLGQQVWDFLRCLDYVQTRSDVDEARIRVFGIGGGGLVTLLGGVLDDRPHAFLCERMIADFRSVLESEEYSVELSWLVPGILRAFDLPDLAACLAPRPVWLLNTVGARNEILSESLLEARFKDAIHCYSTVGASQDFRMLVQPGEERSETLRNWLTR